MKVIEQARAAREAGLALATVGTGLKNRALRNAASHLDRNRPEILEQNGKDVSAAKTGNLQASLRGRLLVDNRKIDQMIANLHDVARLQDPVGRTIFRRELDRGMILTKVSVPLGVVGVIFESRPDALVQIAGLGLKSGNAVILKGGSEAAHSNRILFRLLREAVERTDPVFKDCLQLVETREDIRELLALDQFIDLMIPRGSSELVRSIQENTRIPVLGHAEGICHLYIDREADPDMALNLSYDAKCQYPAVCNSIETLLVHRDMAATFLPLLAGKLDTVELRGDEPTRELIPAVAAAESDWVCEYSDLILAVKVVDSLEEAIAHINHYGSHHTDAIVTVNADTAERFLAAVDSASVMWNCSTRFADGFRYGLGAEVGISTGKIHARGPVGLEGFSSTKFVLRGSGQAVADYAAGKKRFSHRNLIRGND